MTADYADNGLQFLCDNDRAALEQGSAINPKVITARGYTTVQDKRELPRYDFTPANGRVPALLIPLYPADGGEPIYQIRPHTTPEGSGKYFLPNGGRLVVDCNPIARADVLNPDVELWITEGAKKADAAISHGLACASISGVPCWRNKSGPLPCWEHIPLRGRNVVIAFDSDFRTKPQVHREMKRLANWLRSKGAIVCYCLLPEGGDGQKVGLDDFFAQEGSEKALRELLADELPPLDLNGKLALLDCTDTGNAERIAARYGEDLRYCHTWKTWLVWNGRYWERDDTGKAIEYAKKTARLILAEAAATTDDAQRAALSAWSRKTQGRVPLLAMLELAKSLPGIGAVADDFDSDEWLLNVANGTLDLRTCCLREAERDDLLTKSLRVPYEPDAACPTWTRFLVSCLPDADVRAFLQRAAGYSLTGSVRDHVLFFLYGQGRNGKSTFLNTMASLLTGYACHVRADVIMQDRNGPNKGATPELVALRGVRFAAVSELNDGQRLDEGLIKSLTGGDPVTARGNYQAPETFLPAYKLWLAGNHRPVIRGTDEGIWRRPKLIPFTVTVPLEHCDTRLPEKLEAELPGILTWAAQGCKAWQNEGLRPPPSVEAATQEYRAEMDALAPFLEEVCVLRPRLQATKAALWKAYQAWTEGSGEQTYRTQRAFNAAIKRREGISEGTSGHDGAKTWFGVGLKTDAPAGESDVALTVLTEQTENLETFSYTPYANENFTEIQSAQSAQSAKPSPLKCRITPSMRQEVQRLAKARKEANDATRAPSADHGNDEDNLRYEYFGMAAERTLIEELERHGLTPKDYIFLAGNARERRKMAQPDFSLCGLRCDIKACPPGKRYAILNAGKHETPNTRPDYYALCLFDSETQFTVAVVPAADVDTWGKRDGELKPDGTRRKPYYSVARDTLPLVTTLDAFAAQTTGTEDEIDWK